MAAFHGEFGVSALAFVQNQCKPANIMNTLTSKVHNKMKLFKMLAPHEAWTKNPKKVYYFVGITLPFCTKASQYFLYPLPVYMAAQMKLWSKNEHSSTVVHAYSHPPGKYNWQGTDYWVKRMWIPPATDQYTPLSCWRVKTTHKIERTMRYVNLDQWSAKHLSETTLHDPGCHAVATYLPMWLKDVIRNPSTQILMVHFLIRPSDAPVYGTARRPTFAMSRLGPRDPIQNCALTSLPEDIQRKIMGMAIDRLKDSDATADRIKALASVNKSLRLYVKEHMAPRIDTFLDDFHNAIITQCPETIEKARDACLAIGMSPWYVIQRIQFWHTNTSENRHWRLFIRSARPSVKAYRDMHRNRQKECGKLLSAIEG